jgi:hypothetical protein
MHRQGTRAANPFARNGVGHSRHSILWCDWRFESCACFGHLLPYRQIHSVAEFQESGSAAPTSLRRWPMGVLDRAHRVVAMSSSTSVVVVAATVRSAVRPTYYPTCPPVHPATVPVRSAYIPACPSVSPPVHPPTASVILSVGLPRIVRVLAIGQLDFVGFCRFLIGGNFLRFAL